MTARDIQRRLIFDRYRRSFTLGNYSPARWWECDVFEITSAGFFYEYEIKMTRGDFWADASKIKNTNGRFDGNKWVWDKINKHEQLKTRHISGPSRFWFVTPFELVTVDEIPRWAGLIYAKMTELKPEWQTLYSTRLTLVKSAPRLHLQKCDPKVVEHSKTVCYWRMHHLLFGRQTIDLQAEELAPMLDHELEPSLL